MSRPRISEEEKKIRKQAYMKKYWQEHRAEQNAARKRWRENHPEEERKRNTINHRKWRLANKEKYNAYQREWRAKKKAELDKKPQV